MPEINIVVVLFILGGLVLITNVLTQVIKQLTWDKIPSSLLAFIVSQGITLAAFFAYCAIYSVALLWYYVAAAIVVGFFVSFAAMFGFDVLKQKILDWYATKNTGGTQ